MTAEWIKEGAVVIDVGINSIPIRKNSRKTKLVRSGVHIDHRHTYGIFNIFPNFFQTRLGTWICCQ